MTRYRITIRENRAVNRIRDAPLLKPCPPELCASRGDAPAPLRPSSGERIFHPCAAAGGSHGTGGTGAGEP